MIKVFTLNKNDKIELTEQELKDLVREAYNEGYTQGKIVKSITIDTTNMPHKDWWNTGTNIATVTNYNTEGESYL